MRNLLITRITAIEYNEFTMQFPDKQMSQINDNKKELIEQLRCANAKLYMSQIQNTNRKENLQIRSNINEE